MIQVRAHWNINKSSCNSSNSYIIAWTWLWRHFLTCESRVKCEQRNAPLIKVRHSNRQISVYRHLQSSMKWFCVIKPHTDFSKIPFWLLPVQPSHYFFFNLGSNLRSLRGHKLWCPSHMNKYQKKILSCIAWKQTFNSTKTNTQRQHAEIKQGFSRSAMFSAGSCAALQAVCRPGVQTEARIKRETRGWHIFTYGASNVNKWLWSVWGGRHNRTAGGRVLLISVLH